MDQVEITRRIIDEDLRLIYQYSRGVLSGQVKNSELINYEVQDWNALVSLAYFFMIVSTGRDSQTAQYAPSAQARPKLSRVVQTEAI